MRPWASVGDNQNVAVQLRFELTALLDLIAECRSLATEAPVAAVPALGAVLVSAALGGVGGHGWLGGREARASDGETVGERAAYELLRAGGRAKSGGEGEEAS